MSAGGGWGKFWHRDTQGRGSEQTPHSPRKKPTLLTPQSRISPERQDSTYLLFKPAVWDALLWEPPSQRTPMTRPGFLEPAEASRNSDKWNNQRPTQLSSENATAPHPTRSSFWEGSWAGSPVTPNVRQEGRLPSCLKLTPGDSRGHAPAPWEADVPVGRGNSPGWEAAFQKQSKWRSFHPSHSPGSQTCLPRIVPHKASESVCVTCTGQQGSVIKRESSQS